MSAQNLTKRERFALAAMRGLADVAVPADFAAQVAVEYADALLAALGDGHSDTAERLKGECTAYLHGTNQGSICGLVKRDS